MGSWCRETTSITRGWVECTWTRPSWLSETFLITLLMFSSAVIRTSASASSQSVKNISMAVLNNFVASGVARLKFQQDWLGTQISNRGRYSISNINQQLTIYLQMLKTWCINLFLFLQFCVKTWCICSVFYVLQFGRLKLALGAIYLYSIYVVRGCS